MSDINNDNDMVDPSVKKYSPYQNVDKMEEPDNVTEFSSKYLETLYNDYETKIRSAAAYLQKINSQQEQLTTVIEDWTHLLKEKYRILDDFQNSQSNSINPGNFAIEDRTSIGNTEQQDLKKVDDAITDNSEQINYHFVKMEDYIKFLSQIYLDAQDTVNKVYDRFMEIYQNM